jgi:hypothetical protein
MLMSRKIRSIETSKQSLHQDRAARMPAPQILLYAHLCRRGVTVHTVADRIGDDQAVLLRNYAKRKRQNTANNFGSRQ